MKRLDKPILVLDGGLGTTLEDEHGVRFSSETSPLWSSHLLVSSPTTLDKVQGDFASAGADVLLTATYQASFEGFQRTKINHYPGGIGKEDVEKYMLSSVHIARNAFRDKSGLVALSLGAYGATTIPSTEYSGEYGTMTQPALQRFHRERLSVFLNHAEWQQIDLVAFETLPRLDEVKAVRRVMQDLLEEKPYWVSCVFPNSNDDLPDGSTIKEVVCAMLQGSKIPFAVGINCTKLSKIPRLVRQFEDAIDELGCSFPRLVLYPDGAASQVYNTSTQIWETDNHTANDDGSSWDSELYDIIRDVQIRGRWKGLIVGGCCKTAPRHIAALIKRLDDAA